MPWTVSKDTSACPASKPYAVKKQGTGKVHGCHATEEQAHAQQRALYANVKESDMKDQITEAGSVSAGSSSSRRHIDIISEGWGSSGYYSGEVLERDIPKIFPAGTKMYLNHPTDKEHKERPERDLRDLVGVVATTPRMSGITAVAEAEIFPHWAPVINAMADEIGLSIRAFGERESGAAGGKEGNIVKALTEGVSIDYVTEAGRGGKVGPLIESARAAERDEQELVEAAEAAAAEWAEAEADGELWVPLDESEKLYDEFLERDVSKDERVSLAKKGQAIPIKDGDGNVIGGRFPMANCGDVKAAAMSVGRTSMGDIKGFIKRVAGKLSCPVPFKSSESGSPGRTTKEDKLSEQLLTELRESKDKLANELSESKKETKEAVDRAERAEEAIQLREAGSVVSKIIDGDTRVPQKARARAIANALEGELPTKDGKLDIEALEERARKKLREEVEYIAETSGIGKVSGAGGNGGGDGDDTSALVEAFKSRGMSDEAAKIAAEGR